MSQLIGNQRSEVESAIRTFIKNIRNEEKPTDTKFRAESDKNKKLLTLWFYEAINDVPQSLAKTISEHPEGGEILVRINSYGGSAFGGLTIYELLQNYKGTVTTQVDGVAASSAAVIALAGKKIRIVQSGFLFFHRAWAAVVGNYRPHLQIAGELKKVDMLIATILEARTKMEKDKIEALLDGEADGTLLSADEAMELKIVDEIVSAQPPRVAPEQSAAQTLQKVIQQVADNLAGTKLFIPDDPPNGDGEGVEGDWEKPALKDFTDKLWGDLDDGEKREIAKYFAFAFDLETFGALKLPHHYPPNHENKGKASLAGVRNALARVSLVDGMSEEDRDRVRAHLRKHLPKQEDSADVDAYALAILHAF